jgi:homeobox protein cut-like
MVGKNILNIDVPLTMKQEESQKSSAAGKLELENKSLRSQLDEYQEEFRGIKNQEVTIRRLEDKIKEYDTRMESLVQEQVQQTEVTLREESETVLMQMKERSGHS